MPHELSSHDIEAWLRSCDPPIIVRLEKNNVLLDVRTIQEEEFETVAQAIKKLAGIPKK
jgi:L-seryl-tRNA(Ser) seleniumtransferase